MEINEYMEIANANPKGVTVLMEDKTSCHSFKTMLRFDIGASA